MSAIEEASRKAWKLVRDEGFQNRHQLRTGLSGNLQKVRDLSVLGSLDCPIGVNGAYGEITYLSLLRTGYGVHLAFHRVGSVQSTMGLVDQYQLLSLDLKTKATLHLDPYYKKRSKQAPAGFQMGKEFLRGNPILGCNFFVPDFPLKIAECTREMQKKIYGVPFPIEALRELETRFLPAKLENRAPPS